MYVLFGICGFLLIKIDTSWNTYPGKQDADIRANGYSKNLYQLRHVIGFFIILDVLLQISPVL
jgi:hypothetical protein